MPMVSRLQIPPGLAGGLTDIRKRGTKDVLIACCAERKGRP